MDAIQTLAQELSKALSGNDLYDTYRKQWRYLLESYVGGSEYRRAGHLARYQLETDAEYDARLRNTPLENHCQSVVSVYNSFLFRTQPDRDLGTLEGLVDDFLEDADFDGRSFDAFMKDVATWSSVFGHCWVIVAKPNVGASNRAEEMAVGVRPYVSLLTPLAVLDWEYARSPNGRYTLSYLKYLEDVNGDVHTIKEWTTDAVRTRVIDSGKNQLMEDQLEDNQLGMIPAVCAYNRRSIIRGIGTSDIADIADAQRYIYNATSEIFQSVQMDTHPSLVATDETQVGTGSGALIRVSDSMDPGLKPYLLEFSGASVSTILESINHTIESIDKMANTGAIRATESRTLSGVAMETEFSLLNARLSEKGDAMELIEEQIWQIYAEYEGYPWTGSIEYADSFNLRDRTSEINQLKVAKETATSPRVLAAIDRQLLDWMDEEYEEEMEHPTTDQSNRVEHIQAMIMEGYEDEQILALHAEISSDDIQNAKQQLLEQ